MGLFWGENPSQRDCGLGNKKKKEWQQQQQQPSQQAVDVRCLSDARPEGLVGVEEQSQPASETRGWLHNAPRRVG